MKRGALVLLVLALLASPASSQTFDVQVLNQETVGSDFYLDIYMWRTGDTPLYLANADLVLTFNSQYFTSPIVTLEASDDQLDGFYTVSPTIGSLNLLIVNVASPVVGSTAQLTARALNVSVTGSLIARLKIAGITNLNGTMGLLWRRSGLNATAVTAFDPATFNTGDITGNGTYLQPADKPLPISLASFTGTADMNQNGVVLTWKTLTETNNFGFYIQRKSGSAENFTDLAFVPSMASDGTTLEPQQYRYVDKSIAAPGKFSYRLKQVDRNETSTVSEAIVIDVTLTDVAEAAPRQFQLLQNFPNPFNPSTQVRFSVENTTHATMKAYNTLGEEVATLFDGVAEAGRYYLATFNAQRLASGVYFYRLSTDQKVDVKRMLLVK
jgi:hypothetical protein